MHFPNHPNIKYDIFWWIMKKGRCALAVQQKKRKKEKSRHFIRKSIISRSLPFYDNYDWYANPLFFSVLFLDWISIRMWGIEADIAIVCVLLFTWGWEPTKCEDFQQSLRRVILFRFHIIFLSCLQSIEKHTFLCIVCSFQFPIKVA